VPIRDVLVTVGIIGSLPFCFRRPWIGILEWIWFGVMGPHTLVWGFAYQYPFAQLIAAATLAGIPFARDRKPLPRTRETYIVLTQILLFTITTVFAMYPDDAWEQWTKVSKTLLFTVLAFIFLQDRTRIRYLALVLALSIGFFGLKGGLWVLMTGGTNQVLAPDGSSLAGNNALGLGIAMALPFLFFLARDEARGWLRLLLRVMFVMSIPAALFTYSRGALLAVVTVLWLIAVKTKRKYSTALVFGVVGVLILNFAPPQWFQRTETIVHYEGDGSAMGRLMLWGVAFRFALDHPLLGGGYYVTAREEITHQYGGHSGAVPHSIWFSTLSEHGLPGLILFVALMLCCVMTLRRLRKPRDGHEPAQWIVTYSHMAEISIAGYAVAGTFLNLAYLDVYYAVVAFVICLDVVATREARDPSRVTSSVGRPSGVAFRTPKIAFRVRSARPTT
jgi:probable O-glycosylation ligase (exosortase A-associated)